MSDNASGDVNVDFYRTHVSCLLCHGWFERGVAIAVSSLPPHQRGLVRLEGLAEDADPHVCPACLQELHGDQESVGRYLNAFAHLESYHEIVQAFGRAFLGVVLVSNLFASTHPALLVVSAIGFTLCDWGRLLELLWAIIKFPPLLMALVFVPWTTFVYFGTRPFSFSLFIDDPFAYFPWRTFTLFDDAYLEAVFLGMFVVGLLYLVTKLSVSYVDGPPEPPPAD